jgi:hypothetical protein
MTDLVGGQPALRSFQGQVVRGHFERSPQTPILNGVVVNVEHVVYFREFDPQAQKLPLAYLLFGRGQELFLAHMISAPPDFDQLLAVQVTGHAFTDEELRHGLPVALSGRTNAAGTRLKKGERVVCQFRRADAPAPIELQLEAGEEFYCEEGELDRPVAPPPQGFPPSRVCQP